VAFDLVPPCSDSVHGSSATAQIGSTAALLLSPL